MVSIILLVLATVDVSIHIIEFVERHFDGQNKKNR